MFDITKIGITHHGSIFEELIFNGIPCIGSKAAPWTSLEIDGLYTYETIKEYEALISSIPIIANNVINKDDIITMQNLYEYVYKTRIEPNESCISHPLDIVSNGLESLISNSSWLSSDKLILQKDVYEILYKASRETNTLKLL